MDEHPVWVAPGPVSLDPDHLLLGQMKKQTHNFGMNGLPENQGSYLPPRGPLYTSGSSLLNGPVSDPFPDCELSGGRSLMPFIFLPVLQHSQHGGNFMHSSLPTFMY